MEGPVLNLFGIFALLKTCFSPKSEISSQSETTSIPPFHNLWEYPTPHPPPPSEKKNLFHIQGFTFTKVIKQRLEQLEMANGCHWRFSRGIHNFPNRLYPPLPNLSCAWRSKHNLKLEGAQNEINYSYYGGALTCILCHVQKIVRTILHAL